MATRVRFHFDPLCPWAWQSSKWMREVENVRDVEVEWRLFSLRLINENQQDPLADAHAKGTPALRALALVRREEGNDAVGRVYEALGGRIHEGPSEEMDQATVRSSLEDAGLDPTIVDRALDDDSTMADVRAEHDAAVSEVGVFGVPTIVLATGEGMFGPVIAKAPSGEAAGELWDHVEWLIRQDGLFELKRERDRKPGA
ncbi:MAG: DsbA family protein [Actinobacteria bacterium]|nr:DsbA family protein [Actinomycetota bacterium]